MMAAIYSTLAKPFLLRVPVDDLISVRVYITGIRYIYILYTSTRYYDEDSKREKRYYYYYCYYYISSDGKYVPETKDLHSVAAAKGRLTTCDISIGPDSLNNRQFPEPAKGFGPSTSAVCRGGVVDEDRGRRRSGLQGSKTLLVYRYTCSKCII